MDIYAEEAHLNKRFIIPVPFLTPTLSALWIHLISPVPTSIALPLTEGLTSNAVCTENRIRSIIPQKLLTCREAIRLALDRIEQEKVDTCWMDAGNLLEPEWAHCGDAEWAGGTIMSCGYRATLKASSADVWYSVCRIGGKTGWYFGNFLWRLRGILDRLAGSSQRTTGQYYLTCIGRHLGAAAALLDRPEEARKHYQEAIKVCTEMRFRPELALTRLQLAELLLEHYPDEKPEALEHLDFAINEFREMKMQPSLERALRHKDILRA